MRFAVALLGLSLLAPLAANAQPADGSCDDAVDSTGTLVANLARVLPAPRPPAALPPTRTRDELPFHVAGLSDQKLAVALRAYSRAKEQGLVANTRLTVIDYSLPSTARRMWVIDPATGAVLFHELVAHGQGSGENRAERFGNVDSSHRTSLGVFRTAETYSGKHGHSLKLDGHDPGVNDNARDRAIVIHAADYVSERFVRAHGRLGRSHGCPALDPRITRRVIDEVKGGSILVSFGGDDAWVARSPLARP